MPKFSIVITCYNHRTYIVDAIRSALAQTLPAAEIIVVDDNSPDGSAQVLDSFGDSILAIKNATNHGANQARNIGAAQATGDYLVFLDGDDVFCREALEVYGRLVDGRSPVLILSQLGFFAHQVPDTGIPAGAPLEFVHYPRLLLKDRSYASSASSIVVARSAFETAGGWTDVFPCEDTDLFLRVAPLGSAIQILSPETALKRGHETNYSRDILAMTRGMFKVLAAERAGCYRKGESLFARYCFMGGPAFHWIKKCFSIHAYGTTLRLIVQTWPMVIAAILHKIAAKCGLHGTVQRISLREGRTPAQVRTPLQPHYGIK